MYCSKCGIEMPDDANFCASCGQATGTVEADACPSQSGQPAPPAVASNGPLLVLKPRLLPFPYLFAKLVPVGLFATFFCGMFLGVPGAIIGAALLREPFYMPAVLGALFGAIGVPCLVYSLMKKSYEKTEYRFYADHIEYYEGLWNVVQKSIEYRRITEVNLVEGVFQKKVGRGSLLLATPATSVGSNSAGSGVTLRDIDNPHEVYTQVKDLVATSDATRS